MQKAIDLAVENARTGRGGPFGAVVVRENTIVATGVNTVTSTLDPTAHAEVNAVRSAARALNTFDLTGCDIYTSCEPCPMCLGAIYWARIGRIYYAALAGDAHAAGFDDRRIYNEISLPPAARSVTMINMLREESLVAFEAWRNSPNRIEY